MFSKICILFINADRDCILKYCFSTVLLNLNIHIKHKVHQKMLINLCDSLYMQTKLTNLDSSSAGANSFSSCCNSAHSLRVRSSMLYRFANSLIAFCCSFNRLIMYSVEFHRTGISYTIEN